MTETDIERLTRLAGNLPGVEVAPWYGTPGLKVGGKGFARVKSPACLMVLCPLGLKEALMEVEPHLYFETPHYHGWPGMLVHMDLIDDRRLQDRLECLARARPAQAGGGLGKARGLTGFPSNPAAS